MDRALIVRRAVAVLAAAFGIATIAAGARVLAKGRSTGAGFSEVFIEDKRSMGAGLDDGRVEQVSSGRDSGAGIRVINGETTGFAYTADLSAEWGRGTAAYLTIGVGQRRKVR